MNGSYLRSEKVANFNLEAFIDEVEALPTLRAKLERFNEYFDLLLRGKTQIQNKFSLECSNCNGRFKEGNNHNRDNAKAVHDYIVEIGQAESQRINKIATYAQKVKVFYKRFGRLKAFSISSLNYLELDEITRLGLDYHDKWAVSISIDPKNDLEREILNTFESERLKPEFDLKFEQWKKDFKYNYTKRAITNEEKVAFVKGKLATLMIEEQNNNAIILPKEVAPLYPHSISIVDEINSRAVLNFLKPKGYDGGLHERIIKKDPVDLKKDAIWPMMWLYLNVELIHKKRVFLDEKSKIELTDKKPEKTQPAAEANKHSLIARYNVLCLRNMSEAQIYDQLVIDFKDVWNNKGNTPKDIKNRDKQIRRIIRKYKKSKNI